MGQPRGVYPTLHRTMSIRSTTELHLAPATGNALKSKLLYLVLICVIYRGYYICVHDRRHECLDPQRNLKMVGVEREMFYLTTHSTHFIYGYMASDIWLRTILIVRKETRCRHIGYSYRLTARVLLYAPSHRQDNNTTAFVTPVVEHWLEREIAQWVHPMKDRSDDPSHHERTLYL